MNSPSMDLVDMHNIHLTKGFPAKLYGIEQYQWLGPFKLLPITIYPIHYLEQNLSLIIIKDMILEIEFTNFATSNVIHRPVTNVIKYLLEKYQQILMQLNFTIAMLKIIFRKNSITIPMLYNEHGNIVYVGIRPG
ncbi:MAG: hypothetical protein DRO15_02720 [Thermoprotei archaeon]|nr:MAG: hypothetical protein DRO15_02720 [Thermoprotei archaeon]